MKKNTFLLGFAFIYIIGLHAQQLPNRYLDEITTNE